METHFSRKIQLGIAAVILLMSSISTSYAETPTDRVTSKIPDAGPGGFTRITFFDGLNGANYSVQPNAQHSNFNSVLKVCSESNDSECIESLSYRKKGDVSWVPGKLLSTKNPSMNGITALTYSKDGSTQNYGQVSRNAATGRPAGDMSSNWELPGAIHLGGSEYLLSVNVSNFPRGYISEAYDFSISLSAVQWKTPPQFGAYDKTANSTTQFNLPNDIEYQVKVRLGIIENKIINWYNGRISNPNLDLSNGTLTISGSPTYYPIAGTNYFKCSEILGEKRLAIINAYGESSLNGPMCNDLSGSSYGATPQDAWAFKAFDLWDSDIKEYGKNSSWSITASSNLGVCSTAEIAGVVSSNALLYTVSPPTFDATSKTLSYRIASTHLDASGRVNKGSFNLVLNKEVARCLWGFDAGKLAEAKIQVTYSDGKPIIGTSTMNVRGDWVYIHIENFTFSSPTFNIKAVEEVKVAPTPSPTPAPSLNSESAIKPPVNTKKKSTVTCIKGKLTKKVTSTNPKCPAGFKKK
jgi:hypothetical protein